MQEIWSTKCTSSSFFLRVANHFLIIKKQLLDCFPWYKLLVERFSSIGTRKGKYEQGRGNTPRWEQIGSLNNLPSTQNFLSLLLHLYSANFRAWPTEMVETEVPQSRILVYLCTGCGTSKIYFCLEDSRSSLSWMSLKSKTKDGRP